MEAKIGDDWTACRVASIHRRGVLVRPLDGDAGPWLVENPVRLRPLSQERLEAWLAAE